MDSKRAPDDGIESFDLALDDLKDVQLPIAERLAAERSRTENWIARALVIAVIGSLPVMLLASIFLTEQSELLQKVFDKWITIVGPLVGAAVGFGALMARNEKSGRKNG